MKDLNASIAEKFQDKNFEKKYLRSSALYRLAGEMLLLRKQRGLTQQELADKVGSTQAVISRLESASVKPSLETILKIAEALDATVDVRLLPVEKIRRNQNLPEIENKRSEPLKGILYFDQEQVLLGANEKWISPQNTPIPEIRAKTPDLMISHQRKIREYA